MRKDEWRALDTGGRNVIKGHTRFLNSLSNSNRRINRAWVLKDEFDQIWNYINRASAEKFLKCWMTTALRSRITSLRQFVGTVEIILITSSPSPTGT